MVIFCGVATKIILTNSDAITKLSFYSDSVTNKAGFNMTYAQYEGKEISKVNLYTHTISFSSWCLSKKKLFDYFTFNNFSFQNG